MKKLEDRIMDRMYKVETERSSLSFVMKSGLFLVSAVIVFIFGQMLWDIFSVEKTFGVFEIFSDDVEVVWKHFGDISSVILMETPKEVFAILFGAGLVSGALALTFFLHFGKIWNKTKSLLLYWRKRIGR